MHAGDLANLSKNGERLRNLSLIAPDVNRIGTLDNQQPELSEDRSGDESVSESVNDSVNESVLEKLRQRTITAEEILSLLTRYRLLPQLLRELVIDQAIAAFTCTFEETISACKQFYEQNQIASERDRQAWLASNNLTMEQLDALITRNLRIEKFKQATWSSKLESYFLKRKPQLDRIVYSLLRTKDLNITQELYFRIQAGEQTFAELARQYSQGPEAQTDGLIGPAELSTPHPVLAQALVTSQPGQLLQPTQLNDWFVIARLEKLMPAQLDQPMRQRLLNELFENWLKERIKEEGSQNF